MRNIRIIKNKNMITFEDKVALITYEKYEKVAILQIESPSESPNNIAITLGKSTDHLHSDLIVNDLVQVECTLNSIEEENTWKTSIIAKSIKVIHRTKEAREVNIFKTLKEIIDTAGAVEGEVLVSPLIGDIMRATLSIAEDLELPEEKKEELLKFFDETIASIYEDEGTEED